RKPRTYRRKARKQYLALSKQRQPSTDKIRKGIHQQLGYVRRNLKHVGTLATETGLQDRKSTRLNSSHVSISYAVFCLKQKNKIIWRCFGRLNRANGIVAMGAYKVN